ncbi:HNH endonuclease [Burkholderia cepacia]|uniref:HNH endonuclease n=1 Tax=Burkholderia cepacia TaxID=292 RepID=UPI001CF43EF8|nr:HNH endonuclease [Burkholderia cepacia]MCA8079932.1 HNH endonuclease [Burkholderia cepacia]
MPKKAPTPCRHRGCGRLVDSPGFCEVHKADAVGWRPDRERGNRHARGFGSNWERTRAEIMKRDKALCQSCLRAGRVVLATSVDHIVNRAEGGTDDHSNLEALCDKCHNAKTAKEAARARARRRRAGRKAPGVDGALDCWPTPGG